MKIDYKNTYLYKLLASIIHKWSVTRNPENEMRRVYYKTFHHYPDLENPKNLIEKIYWMQLHTDTSMWTLCADKYAMRQYVRECGYESFLPRLLGKWDKATDIDFESLPNEFVLKTNNGCGTVLVVRDKTKLDERATKKKLQRWLNVPYGWAGGQLHYTRIIPCIIAEELLQQDVAQRRISPLSMVDYKVWCLGGKPESIFVAYNRHDSKFINTGLFSTDWKSLAQFLKNTAVDVYNPDITIPKPDCIEEMLSIAEKLAAPFPQVRVDFYVVHNRPVIGEMTFTTGYGYFTDEYYEYLGDKLDLSRL